MTDITKISNKALGEEIERRITAGGGKLILIGFGSFKRVQVGERSRKAFGASITTPAHETTKFKATKAG